MLNRPISSHFMLFPLILETNWSQITATYLGLFDQNMQNTAHLQLSWLLFDDSIINHNRMPLLFDLKAHLFGRHLAGIDTF